MIISNIMGLKIIEKIICICDGCNKEFERSLKNTILSRKKWNNKDYCKNCSCKKSVYKKPQCSKEYWTDSIKKEHSEKIKNSENFKQGMLNHKDTSGENNGMYNKKHTVNTIQKMSIKRTGKKQSKKTIEKRKETQRKNRELNPKPIKSLNSKVKGYIHRELGWYKRIYERDNFCCTKCGLKNKIDAHHIKPISKIIKELLLNTTFMSDIEKFNYLILQEEIIDKDLKNGITLCRECHKKEHYKWGSHNAK